MRHAIVGAGFGATGHLPAFAGLGGVEVVALCDSGSGRAAKAGHADLATYVDWRRMLDEVRPDTLSVVVPPPTQRVIVEAALGLGIHVLCEKPLGMTPPDARAMAAAAERARRVGAVALQFRFEPGMSALRQQIREARVGRVRRVDFSWMTSGRADASRPWGWQHDAAAGGGVIYAFLPHVIDLVRWLSGSEVTTVAARSAILVGWRPDGDSMRAVTAEDMVDAICELEGGAVASLRVTNCQPCGDGMRIEVHGDDGVLLFAHRPPFAGDVELSCHRRGSPVERLESRPREAAAGDSRSSPLRELAGQFIDAARGGRAESLPTFTDGWHAQCVMAAMRRSVAEQRFAAL
jgi:predicted dehydrogenase